MKASGGMSRAEASPDDRGAAVSGEGESSSTTHDPYVVSAAAAAAAAAAGVADSSLAPRLQMEEVCWPRKAGTNTDRGERKRMYGSASHKKVTEASRSGPSLITDAALGAHSETEAYRLSFFFLLRCSRCLSNCWSVDVSNFENRDLFLSSFFRFSIVD